MGSEGGPLGHWGHFLKRDLEFLSHSFPSWRHESSSNTGLSWCSVLARGSNEWGCQTLDLNLQPVSFLLISGYFRYSIVVTWRWLIYQSSRFPSHFLLSMQYSSCSLRICGTPWALPDAAEGHFRLLVLPLAEKKSFRSTYLKGCGREGHERISTGYVSSFFRKDDFKYKTMRQPGIVVHSYSPSTWEAKGRWSGVQGYPGLFSEFHPNSLKHMRPHLINPKGCGLFISCAQNSSQIFLLTPCENGPISWSACVLAGRRN